MLSFIPQLMQIIRVLLKYVQKHKHFNSHGGRLICGLLSVHIPVLSGSIELLEEERYISLNNGRNDVNALLTAATLLLGNFCKLLFLITTCPQASIPRARIEGVVFPNVVRSAFNSRDFFSELGHCQHLFWTLTGESDESFLQIVHGVGPTIYSQTRRGDRRLMDYPYILDMRNRILLVIIWLQN